MKIFPPSLRLPFSASLLISCFLALSLLVLYFRLQPVVPLFYSLAETRDYLAPKIWLVIFPGMSFAVTILHAILIRSLSHHEKIVPTLFAWSTLVIQVLFLLAYIRIILIIM